MKPIVLLNISDANNTWNKSVLEMAWKKREQRFRELEAEEAERKRPGFFKRIWLGLCATP